MPKINTVTTGHGNKTENYAGGLSIQYNHFPEIAKADKDRLAKVKKAVEIVEKLDRKIDLNDPCNKYFGTLSRNNPFRHYWRDQTIFIDFSPSLTNGFYGATHSTLKDMCLTAWCIDKNNIWMIAATIVHEFAHIAGAPGGASHAAEKAADMCGFKPQYNPLILGSLQNLGKYLEKLAA